MKKGLLKSVFSPIVIAIFLGFCFWYISSNWNDFVNLSIVSPLFLLLAVPFLLLNMYSTGMLLDLTIEPHGINISKKEAFSLAIITRFSNQISPSYVGATIRATYLKKMYGVAYAKFSSSFLMSNVLQFLISGILIIISSIILSSAQIEMGSLTAVIAITTVLIFVFYFPVHKVIHILNMHTFTLKGTKKIAERLSVLLDGYSKVRSHPKLLPRTILWMFTTILSSSAAYWLLYSSLGIDINFASTLFIASLSSWSTIFAITPGSIGVRETLMVLAAQAADVSITATLLVALLLRITVFV
ncbi:flippase-like domain-containing protein, partial [Candidatus Saccharibacteria bacterium]|nr:flippase-like domain-containing protein [Candidatus Saccharibacteria bacterium]